MLFISVFSLSANSELPNWNKIDNAWFSYLQEKTTENLLMLKNSIPSVNGYYLEGNESTKYFINGGDVVEKIWNNLWFLEREIYAGVPNAVDVWILLRHIAYSNEFYNKIISSLGELIRINPELFLKKINELNFDLNKGELELILTLFDYKYTDLEKTIYIEISERIDRLNEVSNVNLASVKEKCISILKKKKDMYEKIINAEKQ